LTINVGVSSAFFGVSVAISGDTLVVGAIDIFGSYPSYIYQGAAYIFTRSGTVWTLQQRLTAGDLSANSFGSSIAIGCDAVVVSTRDLFAWYTYQPTAYVFTRSGTVWTLQQKLNAGDATAASFYGTAVAISGDTVVMGAPYETIGANYYQGGAYV